MKQLHKQNDLSNAYRNEAKIFVAVFGTGKIYLPITLELTAGEAGPVRPGLRQAVVTRRVFNS